VEFAGETIADTGSALRVLETAHPPTYYIPPGDVRSEYLSPGIGRSFCEWKGVAAYWSLQIGDRWARNAAWSFPDPAPPYEELRDRLAFYAQRVGGCYVGEERATPQPGHFYGGWVTSKVVGPFKGEPGTEGW
jgi:uncharacterized protein (DUF427 family)